MRLNELICKKEIIERELKRHGYDGLFSVAGECACRIGDIAPCVDIESMFDHISDCECGYIVDTPDHPEFDWMIHREKPEIKK